MAQFFIRMFLLGMFKNLPSWKSKIMLFNFKLLFAYDLCVSVLNSAENEIVV